uniref:Uncharacterized protein n=1 Tax=Anguilla anguilla TaxID=7936 RepID=A0A0E9UZT7_ANGAN
MLLYCCVCVSVSLVLNFLLHFMTAVLARSPLKGF